MSNMIRAIRRNGARTAARQGKVFGGRQAFYAMKGWRLVFNQWVLHLSSQKPKIKIRSWRSNARTVAPPQQARGGRR